MTPTPETQAASSGATSTGERTWRSAVAWCELLDVRIVDPDGWRDVRDGDAAGLLRFETAWKQRISREEFERRYSMSTVDPRGRKAWLESQQLTEAVVGGPVEPVSRERREHLAQATDLLTLENAIRGGQAGAKVWTCGILTRRRPEDAVWLHLSGPCVADVESGVPVTAYEVPSEDGLVNSYQRAGFLRPWKGEPGGAVPFVDNRPAAVAAEDDRLEALSVADAECARRWPDAEVGAYDPRCCRFPKSCSVGIDYSVRTPEDEEAARRREEFVRTPLLEATTTRETGPAAVRERDRVWTLLEQRLQAAQRALHQVGYWKPEEIGPDVAPRILELGSKLTSLQDQLEATQVQLERAVGLAHPDRLTAGELDQLPTLDVSGVNLLAVDVKAQRNAWERAVAVEFLEHLPEDGAQAVDYVSVLATAMIEARP